MLKMTVEIWEEGNAVLTKVETPMCKATRREVEVAEAVVKAINAIRPKDSIASQVIYNKSFMKPVPDGNPELQ